MKLSCVLHKIVPRVQRGYSSATFAPHHPHYHRSHFDWLSAKLQIDLQHEWYSMTGNILRENGGRILQHHYQNSLTEALHTVYPEYTWYSWLFTHSPQNYWQDKCHQQQYFEWLAEELCIETQQDWYHIRGEDISNRGGGALLHGHYGLSVLAALQTIYPQYEWHPWQFSCAPQQFWMKQRNHRWYMEWLGEVLGIDHQSQWYEVNSDEVVQRGGDSMIRYHGSSMYRALQNAFPEHEWDGWRFKSAPHGYWSEKNNQRRYFEWVQEQLQLKDLQEWREVAAVALREQRLRASGLLHLYGGALQRALKSVFGGEWSDFRSSYAQQQLQQLLSHSLSSVALEDREKENLEVLVNYKHPQMTHSLSEEQVELDVYIPSLQLALEYQGAQHYQQIHTGSQQRQEQRDSEKRRECERLGITLVEIPFWWDCRAATLESTIRSKRPDISFSALL